MTSGPATPAPASGNGASNGDGNGIGASGDAGLPASAGQRLKRRLAGSTPVRPSRDPILDVPDAVDAGAGAGAGTPVAAGDGGPALLPPIRIGGSTDDGSAPVTAPAGAGPAITVPAHADPSAPAPAAGGSRAAGPFVSEPPAANMGSASGPASVVPPATIVPLTGSSPADQLAAGSPLPPAGRTGPAAPTVKPVLGSGAAANRVMPFVRPPVQPTVAPGELVARKVVAPLEAAPLDVPMEVPPAGQPTPRVGRPSITFQRRRTRPRVRRVTRVVRHIDTWSVFKVALVFSAFLYAVALTAGVLLWHVAIATGTVDNVERFFEGFGWESFRFKGGEIYHNAWVAGLFVAIGLTGLAVLFATMFNLITDLVGGIRVSVLEEEVLARRDRTAKVVVEDDPDVALPYDQARSG